MIVCIGERVNDRSLTAERVARWRHMWDHAPDDRLCGYIRYTPAMTKGPTCARLCRLLGMQRDDFLIWNLLPPDNQPGMWDADLAWRCATLLSTHMCAEGNCLEDRFLLMGKRVATAFNFSRASFGDRELIHSPEGSGWPRQAMVVPHPSGRSRFWNDPEAEGEIRSRIQGFVAEGAAA